MTGVVWEAVVARSRLPARQNSACLVIVVWACVCVCVSGENEGVRQDKTYMAAARRTKSLRVAEEGTLRLSEALFRKKEWQGKRNKGLLLVVEMEGIVLCVVGCGWSSTDKHKQGKRRFEEQAMGRLDQGG